MPYRYNPITGAVYEKRGGDWYQVDDAEPLHTGAPASVRAAVGPEDRKLSDRLKTLQQYYPGATVTPDRQLVFPNPAQRGYPTLYNPPGLDIGDVAEHARLIPEAVGGVAGGLVGGPMAPLGAALGAEAAGQLWDIGLQQFTPRVETRTPLQTASQGVLNIGTSLAGEKALERVVPGFRRMIGAQPTPEQASVRTAFEMEDIPMQGVPGAVTQSGMIQGAEEVLSKMPTSSATIGEARERTFDQMQARLRQTAEGFGTPRAPTQIGEEIAQSATNQLQQLSDRARLLTDDLVTAVGADTPVNLTNVTALRDELATQIEQSPETYKYLKRPLDQINKWMTEAEARGGAMPFELVNAYRHSTGEAMKPVVGAAPTYTTNEQSVIKRLYGALARDIDETAEAAGPQAQRALERQRRYIRQQMQGRTGTKKTQEQQLRDISTQTGKQAWDRMWSAAKAGSKELRRARKAMDMSTWNDFRASVLENMGRTTAGRQGIEGEVFSPAAFVTKWNQLPADSRRLLFGGRGYGQYRDSINRLGRIFDSVKDADKLRNYSNTGAFNVMSRLLELAPLAGFAPGAFAGDVSQALSGAATTLGAVLGTPYLTSRLMTNPDFVRFLVSPVDQLPGGLSRALSRTTARMIQHGIDDATQRDLFNFLDAMSGPPEPPQQ